MKKKVNIVSLALVFAMVVTLFSGCGAKQTSKDISDTPANVADGSAEKPADSDKGDEVTLKWAVWDIASTTYYQPLIDGFKEENPNVTIEMVDLGSQDYQTVLATQLSGDDTDLDVVCVKDIPGYVNLVAKKCIRASEYFQHGFKWVRWDYRSNHDQ